MYVDVILIFRRTKFIRMSVTFRCLFRIGSKLSQAAFLLFPDYLLNHDNDDDQKIVNVVLDEKVERHPDDYESFQGQVQGRIHCPTWVCYQSLPPSIIWLS